jgi:methyl-accepting chemotaxis protein
MKRRWFDDLPLIVKIGFAPTLAVIMLAALTVTSVVLQRNQVQQLEQVVAVDMPNSMRLQKVAERITNVHGTLYYLLTHQAAQIDADKIEGEAKAMMDEVDSIAKELTVARNAADQKDRAEIDLLIKDVKDTRDAIDIIVAMMSADFASAAGFAAPFEDQYGKMNARLQKIVAANKATVEQHAVASRAASAATQTLFIGISLVTLLAVAGIALFLTLNMRKAVKQIAGATERLSHGDNNVNLDALARKDELGAIVNSLTIFRDNQLNLETLRKEQEADRIAAEEARKQSEKVAAEHAEEQATVVSNLAHGLERLATGDLTIRLSTAFPGEYEKLRQDFNGAVVKLEEALSAIASSTAMIRSSGSEIAQGADDLSQRTEHQAATLEETAAALSEITSNVKKSAEGATQSREAVGSAKTDAERTGQVVGRAVVAMNEIEKSAREISQIIGVVDEIAFQTNLLALNAGVEAARAGEAGKGFAVVASEVRALAQRSADSAKQIKGLISTSTSQVVEGVALVGEAGTSLNRIVEHVNEVARLVGEIAASAQEEALGLGEVNTSVAQMDQVTQQNAAMVEETTAASRMLADQAEELFNLVQRFKLSESASRAFKAAGGRSAPASSHAPSAPSPAQAAAPTRTAHRVSGNTALADDDWEEF